jgi:hypothetical protein
VQVSLYYIAKKSTRSRNGGNSLGIVAEGAQQHRLNHANDPWNVKFYELVIRQMCDAWEHDNQIAIVRLGEVIDHSMES